LSAVAAAATFIAACGDGEPRSEAAYCGRVEANLTDLNDPPITAPSDVGRVLAAWRDVAAAAPIAIDTEWATMIDMLETAITVDPNDPESLQKVSDTARATEPAAKRVTSYTLERCGLTIGVTP